MGIPPVGNCKEWGMRAFWSRKNDEDAARYEERTVGRLRGLSKVELKEGSSQAEQIRARIERMAAEVAEEPTPGSRSV